MADFAHDNGMFLHVDGARLANAAVALDATFKEITADVGVDVLSFGGTGANVLGLKAITQSHHAIFCADSAHVHVDECGAPEKFTGCKLVTLPTPDGKLRVEMIEPMMHGIGVEHHVQPHVIQISQVTEMGTV